MNQKPNYGKIILMSFLGGLAGTLPYLVVNFVLKTTVGLLYLLTGFAAHSFYLYYIDHRKRTKLFPLFSVIGIFLSVILSQLVFFSFDPQFTAKAEGVFYVKALNILKYNITTVLIAIILYFLIALLGELITYFVFKALKIKPIYEERRKRNVRKKF